MPCRSSLTGNIEHLFALQNFRFLGNCCCIHVVVPAVEMAMYRLGLNSISRMEHIASFVAVICGALLLVCNLSMRRLENVDFLFSEVLPIAFGQLLHMKFMVNPLGDVNVIEIALPHRLVLLFFR